MMRLLFVLTATICLSSGLFAQDFLSFRSHFRIELTMSSFTSRQEGAFYINRYGNTPPIYEVIPVENRFGHSGIGANFWYAWNFGAHSFEKIAYGLETGFHYNIGSQSRGYSIGEDTAKSNLRIPVLFGIRLRGAVDPVLYGKFGIGIAGGVDLIRTSIANLNGMMALPKIQGIVSFKRWMLTIGYYPMHIRSYYLLNGEVTDKLDTSFFEWTVRYSIIWYNRKYRKFPTLVKF